ncbi:MAG TPA: dockerin type I domain-containing protein, partial [Planctomycetota bacterium]|nr:dockerin type I domain-containing protein [Planctomycetota bacterium]
WSKVSGPSTVTFGDAAAIDTTATFGAPGVYVLRLTANDSLLQASDDVQITVNPPPAIGAWVAFNDLAGTSSGNVTSISLDSSGMLVDYVTGQSTGVTISMINAGAAADGGGGTGPDAGTPAAIVFGSALTLSGYCWYNNSLTSAITVQLTGLQPDKEYELAFYGNRNNSSYTLRRTLFTISDVDSFTHASSAGVAVSANHASLLSGINPADVVIFSKVKCGADGDATVTVSGDMGTIIEGDGKWYVNGMKVSQLPPKWAIKGDANGDCVVNALDLIFIRNLLGQNPATDDNWKADLNEDGKINVLDLLTARNNMGATCVSLTILNPYSTVDWVTHGQHKANFHTHTTNSDGSLSPAAAINEYVTKGYSMLAITDHNHVTWPWPSQPIFAIQGNELSSGHHMNSLFCGYASTSSDENVLLSGVQQAGGIAILNHPGRYSYTADWYANLFRTYNHLFAMEVYNQGDRYPNDRVKWDQVLGLLMPDKPAWGVSCDDAHVQSHMGNNWNVLLLTSVTEEEVRSALLNGRFYFTRKTSSTSPVPVIDSIAVNAGNATITITGQNYTEIRWISNGQLIHTGATLNCETTPNVGTYVRAELHGPAGITHTNPFAIRR